MSESDNILRPVFRTIDHYEPKTIDWLSRGRFARGKLTDLQGPGGGGKSTLMCDVVARITTGRPLPDGPACPPAGVVMVAAEDDPSDTLRPRLEVAGADLSRVLILDTEVGAIPYLPAGIADFEDAINFIGAAMFIADPITNILDSHINHHKDSDVRSALMPLVAMLRRTNVSGVQIRHVNKSVSSDPAMRGSGSIAFLNVARLGLLLAPDPENPERVVLAPTKSNLARAARSLAFSHEAVPGTDVARLRWHGETSTSAAQLLTALDPEERGKRADAREFLREYLLGGMQATTDIMTEAKRQGLSESTIRRAKEDLGVEPHKINQPGSSVGKWFWSLPLGQGVHQKTAASQDDQDDQDRDTGRVEDLADHLARRRDLKPTGTDG